jgi:hypothetical protein
VSEQDQTPRARVSGNMTLVAGLVITLAMIVAFLWGESHDVDTTALLAILSPVVGGLSLCPIWPRSNAAPSRSTGRPTAT